MQTEIDHRIHSRQSMLFQNRPIIGIWAQQLLVKCDHWILCGGLDTRLGVTDDRLIAGVLLRFLSCAQPFLHFPCCCELGSHTIPRPLG